MRRSQRVSSGIHFSSRAPLPFTSKGFGNTASEVHLDRTQPVVVKQVKEKSAAQDSGAQPGWQVMGQDMPTMDLAAACAHSAESGLDGTTRVDRVLRSAVACPACASVA